VNPSKIVLKKRNEAKLMIKAQLKNKVTLQASNKHTNLLATNQTISRLTNKAQSQPAKIECLLVKRMDNTVLLQPSIKQIKAVLIDRKIVLQFCTLSLSFVKIVQQIV